MKISLPRSLIGVRKPKNTGRRKFPMCDFPKCVPRMEDAREELEDFQSSSRELELELETQLEHLEKRNRELIVATEKLTSERDELKVSVICHVEYFSTSFLPCNVNHEFAFQSRAESGQNFLNSELTQLQDELSKLKSEKEKMQRYIRELEQTNDDLERSKR